MLGEKAACLLVAAGLVILFFTPRARARAVFPVIDLHVDIPWQLHFHHRPIDLSQGQARASALRKGDVIGVVLPLYLPTSRKGGHPEPGDLEALRKTVERLVFTPGSPFASLGSPANSAPRVRAWLSLEGAEALANDPASIEEWIAKGVRLVGVAHTSDNSLAGSSTGRKQGGLTSKGKEMCEHALSRGALLDVSHLSDAAFADVITLSRAAGAPVVASHSDSRVVADHPRNLTDGELRAIAASGGVVGLNLHGPYLSTAPHPGMTEVLRQADHLVAVAGEDHVAIGSDYDGGITPPDDLPDAGSFPELADALLAHGWSEDRVRKVFSENALRVLSFATERAAR